MIADDILLIEHMCCRTGDTRRKISINYQNGRKTQAKICIDKMNWPSEKNWRHA